MREIRLVPKKYPSPITFGPWEGENYTAHLRSHDNTITLLLGLAFALRRAGLRLLVLRLLRILYNLSDFTGLADSLRSRVLLQLFRIILDDDRIRPCRGTP